jgi:hypothetical protein
MVVFQGKRSVVGLCFEVERRQTGAHARGTRSVVAWSLHRLAVITEGKTVSSARCPRSPSETPLPAVDLAVGPGGVDRGFEVEVKDDDRGCGGQFQSEPNEQELDRRDGDDLREEFEGDGRHDGRPGIARSERGVLTHCHCLAPSHPSVRPASMPQPPWMSWPPL